MECVAEQWAKRDLIGTGEATRRQIRGSSLLVAGRLLSVVINFTTQVVMVRYLSTQDYGAIAYGLSVVTLLQLVIALRLGETSSRFVPLYHEQQAHAKVLGTILLVLAAVVLTGLVTVVIFFVLPAPILSLMSTDSKPIHLLSTMIFLAPLGAFDSILMGLFASFARTRAILMRKHILGPGLKLIAVVIAVVLQRDVVFLAFGYLIASGLGVLLYSGMLIRLLHRQGILQPAHFRTLQVPVRAVFAFTLPVFTSNIFPVVMKTISVFLLGYFHGTTQVAFFLVVLPAAELSTTLVMRSCSLLYIPTASRFFAKADYGSIQQLYWQMAIWMAVMAFPIVALMSVLAPAFTTLLYGARYEASGLILALLATGHYVRVAFGFNERTLQVVGKLRYIVIVNALVAAAAAGVQLLLIPRYGALGAALGTAGMLIVHTLLRQIGLARTLGCRMLDRQYVLLYTFIAFSVVSLWLWQLFGPSRMDIALALVILSSLGVLKVSKPRLDIAKTFPELLKLPLLRSVLG